MIENWLVPCNVKVYDVRKHFENNDTIVWRNAFSIRQGDIVYLYVGKPFCEILYRCLVLSDEVPPEILEKNTYAIPKKPIKNYYSKKEKYLILKLEREFPHGTFPLTDLREHGLGQVQLQARLSRQLKAFISSKINSLS